MAEAPDWLGHRVADIDGFAGARFQLGLAVMLELGIGEGRALGCSVQVVVTEQGAIAAAKAAVDDVLAAIDLACSRFRSDSELGRLNAARGRPQRVSPLFARAIALGLRAAALTVGAVDPTVGRASRLARYDRDFDAIAPDGAALRLIASPVAGWRAVDFDAPSRTVRVPTGVELDLGATAKALASDLGAEAALAVAGGGVLVSLGGDITTLGRPPQGGWNL